jgi:hypothetical protein
MDPPNTPEFSPGDRCFVPSPFTDTFGVAVERRDMAHRIFHGAGMVLALKRTEFSSVLSARRLFYFASFLSLFSACLCALNS